jgi:magnesium transporter
VLLIADPLAEVTSVMDSDIRRFHPYDEAREVAKAFERYDLLSAPIVDDRGKLIGRVTADAVMDFIAHRLATRCRARGPAQGRRPLRACSIPRATGGHGSP